MAFDPLYVPSGLRNARNAYEKKINRIKLSKSEDTRPYFLGASRFLTASGDMFLDANGAAILLHGA